MGLEEFRQLGCLGRVALWWFPKSSGSCCLAGESLGLLFGLAGDGSGGVVPSPSVILSHAGGGERKKQEVVIDLKVEVNEWKNGVESGIWEGWED